MADVEYGPSSVDSVWAAVPTAGTAKATRMTTIRTTANLYLRIYLPPIGVSGCDVRCCRERLRDQMTFPCVYDDL